MELTSMGEAIVIGLIIGFLFLAAVITVYILFLVNLKKLLDQVNPDNRTVPPSNVFLMLIPFFSIVYAFFLFPKISESIRNEYETRGLTIPGDALKVLGSAIAGLTLFSTIVNYLKTPLAGIVSVALLVIVIVYWVQSARIRKELSSAGSRPDVLD